MLFLLREIEKVDIHAADVLAKAGLFTNSEILALTRDDLRDLFPKYEDFPRRKTLFDTIHKQPIAKHLLQNVKGFIPHDFIKDALTKDGVLVDYFQHLKDMQTQMKSQMSFIKAHNNLLEGFRKDRQTDHSQERGGAGASCGDESMEHQASSTSNDPQGAQGCETSNVQHQKKHQAGLSGGSSSESDAKLLYKMVVSGKTFGNHRKLMTNVEKQVSNQMKLFCDNQDYELTFVFCPISSCVGTDVKLALANIKDTKPIILVLMHHAYEVKAVTSMKTWPEGANVVSHVNVFYHDTIGLLTCEENDAAVTQIKNTLLTCFNKGSNDTGRNAKGDIISALLREIKQVDRRAAGVLEKAGLFTNSEILALTRDGLRDLFPKYEDFQRRKTLFDTIHKQPIAERLLQNVKGFIPHDFIKDALTKDGVLVEYLQHLKDMETQMKSQMSFIEAHINLLEEFRKDRQTDHSQERGAEFYSGQTASTTNDQVGRHGSPQRAQSAGSSCGDESMDVQAGSTFSYLQGAQGQSASASGGSVASSKRTRDSEASGVDSQKKYQAGSTGGSSTGTKNWFGKATAKGSAPVASSKQTRAKLLYKMVVSGKTFGNHLKLMTNVEKQVSNQMKLSCDNQDYELTFVFCPISSRVGTDVELALANIKDTKPIILVLMHHAYEAKAVTSMKTWPDSADVVLRVNVFYHETIGLLTCEENDAAVTQIKKTLLARVIKGSNGKKNNHH